MGSTASAVRPAMEGLTHETIMSEPSHRSAYVAVLNSGRVCFCLILVPSNGPPESANPKNGCRHPKLAVRSQIKMAAGIQEWMPAAIIWVPDGSY